METYVNDLQIRLLMNTELISMYAVEGCPNFETPCTCIQSGQAT